TAATAVLRRPRASGRVRAVPVFVPVFVGSYLAVCTLVGVAVYALYWPYGPLAAGAFTIAAGVYGFTPLKQHFRQRLLVLPGPHRRAAARSLLCLQPGHGNPPGSPRRSAHRGFPV